MPRATLSEVLTPALSGGYAVAGVVCLGWEDMRAYAEAAEELGTPIILQSGPGCRAHTPLPILAKMMGHLADQASVPIVLHLDHAYELEDCQIAAGEGFTSLMYDGSSKPLADNIAAMQEVVALARSYGISTEGEVGFVGYAAGKQSRSTDPLEAKRFVEESGVDALAVSVGNVHLQQEKAGGLDETAIIAIEKATNVPLVIHGGSGVPTKQRLHLAKTSNICKFNIGTDLRMAFGSALKAKLAENPDAFDRVEILSATAQASKQAAMAAIRSCKG